MLNRDYEFSMPLDFGPQRVLYPLGPYPVIREVAAMVNMLQSGEQWAGRYFFGYSSGSSRAFNFYRREDGIVVAFSAEEWGGLAQLMDKAFALPETQWRWKMPPWRTENSDRVGFCADSKRGHTEAACPAEAARYPERLA